jgi:hypothetical protein
VPAHLLRSALGFDRVLSDAEVALLAVTAWARLRPAASRCWVGQGWARVPVGCRVDAPLIGPDPSKASLPTGRGRLVGADTQALGRPFVGRELPHRPSLCAASRKLVRVGDAAAAGRSSYAWTSPREDSAGEFTQVMVSVGVW